MSTPSKKSWKDFSTSEQAPADTWLTSYGDMMTILLVFFVLLISAAQVSAVKFDRMKRAFQGPTDGEGIEMVLDALEKKIRENQLEGLVNIQTDDTSIQVSFHDRLLFDLGRSEIKPDGQEMLERVAKSLEGLPGYARLAIEGYTDDNPVNPRIYNSNWHLSALRSLAVLQILEKLEICRENCELRGYGEYHPAAPNRDERGQPIAKNQSENRRVVLRIF